MGRMEHDAPIAPQTLIPVEPHGGIDDEQLANVRVDGPEPDDTDPIAPDPETDIDGD